MTYAADGVVVSVTVQEPRFAPGDKALLLASRRADRAPRGRHGLLLSEATDPKNQFVYRVKPPITDWAQKAINVKKAEFLKANPTADADSLLWGIERSLSREE